MIGMLKNLPSLVKQLPLDHKQEKQDLKPLELI